MRRRKNGVMCDLQQVLMSSLTAALHKQPAGEGCLIETEEEDVNIM